MIGRTVHDAFSNIVCRCQSEMQHTSDVPEAEFPKEEAQAIRFGQKPTTSQQNRRVSDHNTMLKGRGR